MDFSIKNSPEYPSTTTDPLSIKDSAKSCSLRSFDVKIGTTEDVAWQEWFEAHGIPAAQVPMKGWAARDPVRNTVSVLTFWTKPDDVLEANLTSFYVDVDDDGNFSGSKSPRYAVLTVQLEGKPLPFPEAGGEVCNDCA